MHVHVLKVAIGLCAIAKNNTAASINPSFPPSGCTMGLQDTQGV